jgi:predicted ATP-dependent serine protease
MIKIIAGEKGTGKTARLVEDINQVASTDSNVVCIERGNRLDQLIKYSVRLVNMKEYPVSGYDQLLAFIGGICSKDYDLTHIYIDSIFKVAESTDMDGLKEFVLKLDTFLASSPIQVMIFLSGKVDELPEEIKKYI